MPTYKITHPDTGQVIRMTGEAPPREADIQAAFAAVSSQQKAKPEAPAQPESNWRQTVSGMARPALEFGGMLVGGAIGGGLSGPAAPVGAVTGGTLGYAGGAQAADLLDSALGVEGRQAPQVSQNALYNEMAQAGGDIKQGLMMEATGAALNPGIPMAVKGAKAMIPKSIKTIPNRLYQSAAKFSTTIPVKERIAMADLAIKEKISPTIKGWETIQNKIKGLNSQVDDIIDDSLASGKKINPDKLLKHFGELKEAASLTGGSAKTNLSAINNAEKQLLAAGKATYTPRQLQTLKKNIYEELNTAMSKISVPYKAKSQKAIAKAAKEELEEIWPILKELNAKEGALINLRKSIETAANRITNRDVLGIGIPIKAGAGAAAGPAASAAGLLSGILDAPRVKSALAIALSGAGKRKGGISPAIGKAIAYTAEAQ